MVLDSWSKRKASCKGSTQPHPPSSLLPVPLPEIRETEQGLAAERRRTLTTPPPFPAAFVTKVLRSALSVLK
ncbi:hypothetical protein CLOM_g15800 [Closterium sp. NIES-68]|nr:hypothetical protein CLOM_g15800 [Closterium sp. NIES-68]GJP78749.1 hypothetical protein CLOP_g9024 [Closterium sp. NIES-67]